MSYASLKTQWEQEQCTVVKSVCLRDSFSIPVETSPQPPRSRGLPYMLTNEFLASQRWKSMCFDPLPVHTEAETHLNLVAEPRERLEALPPLEYIGAIDISFIKAADIVPIPGALPTAPPGSLSVEENSGGSVEDGWDTQSPTAIASLAVLSYPSLTVVYQDYEIVNLSIPYIPTFLAFRELPALLPLFSRLPPHLASARSRMLTLVDGNGYLHPRLCGAATHLGVVLGAATVGVAKELMVLDGMFPRRARAWAREWFGLPVRAVIRAMAEAAAGGVLWAAMSKAVEGGPSDGGASPQARAGVEAGAGVNDASAAPVGAACVSGGHVVGGSATAATESILAAWHAIGFPPLHSLPAASPPSAASAGQNGDCRAADQSWLDEPCWTFPLVGLSGSVWGAAVLIGGAAGSGITASAGKEKAARARPVYVSTGNLCSLATAVRVVASAGTCKVPEPLRAADLGSREVVRRWIAARKGAIAAEAAAASAVKCDNGNEKAAEV